MKSSTNPLLPLTFASDVEIPNPTLTPVSGSKRIAPRSALNSPTICTQFKAQLSTLISKIQSTKPHYIRCIKPNDLNTPDNLDRLRTTEQLRYGGVLEAVRVARSGFPVRLSHEDFYGRYRILVNPFKGKVVKLPRYLPKGIRSDDALQHCSAMIELMWDTSVPQTPHGDMTNEKLMRTIKEAQYWWGPKVAVLPSSIQLGASKVFLRKQAHDLFESRRSRCLNVRARRIEAVVRRFIARCYYSRALASIYRLQIMTRYFLFHTHFVRKRRLNAAIKLQASFRCHLHCRRFKMLAAATVSIQNAYRVQLARRILFALKLTRYTVRLQKLIRRLLARRKYLKLLHAVVKIQGKYRIVVAKEELKALRIQARDLGKLQKSNEDMKAEIDRLRAAVVEAQNKPGKVSEGSASQNAPLQTPKKESVAQCIATPNTNSKQRFQNYVDEFRRKMSVGMVVRVYTMAHRGVEALVTLKEPSLVCFSRAPSLWTYFASFMRGFPELPAISIYDIVDISSGLTNEASSLFTTISQKERAANLFVSIHYRPSMVCAIGVLSSDERNSLLNGIRALMSEIQITFTTQCLSASRAERVSTRDEEGLESQVNSLTAQVKCVLI